MVQLSFFEEVKDKATRLIPTPYMEIVEEATATDLHIPLYEHVMFLCESANTKPDALDDIVRAIRRRIGDDDPAVKHLTVLLLDAMIKNCGPDFHAEVCAQKGLLRDLENVACNRPVSARGMQAKEAALTLILNLSIWFAGHPDPNCHILTTIAGDVRTRCGPNAFDSVRSDSNVQIRMNAGANRNRSRSEAKADPRYRDPRSGDGRVSVVDAIPVILPKPDDIAQMLDTCVTFSEYVQNAELLDDGTVRPDDVIVGFEEKVRRDHKEVQLLLSSDLTLDRDVLTSIRDSQVAVLRSLSEPRGGPLMSSPAHATDPEEATGATTTVDPMRTAQTAEGTPAVPPTSSTPQKATTQAAVVESPAPTHPGPAVDMDDLFAPAPVDPVVPAAPAATSASVEDDLFGAPAADSAPVEAAPADNDAAQEGSAEVPEEEAPEEQAEEPTEESPDDERQVSGSPVQPEEEGEEEEGEEEEAAPPAAASAAEAPRATSISNTVDDDDFDAFLEGRMSKP